MNIIPNTKQIRSESLINEVTDQFNSYLKEKLNTTAEFEYSTTSYSVTLNLPKLNEDTKVFSVTAVGKDVRIDQYNTKFEGSGDVYKTLIAFLNAKVK